MEKKSLIERILGLRGNKVIICGGGHVGYELAKLCEFMEWETTVIDSRPEYASADRFVSARTICGPYDESIRSLNSSKACIVIATPEHKYDTQCLEAALGCDFLYIGMMGSKSKAADTLNLMRQHGFSENDIKRVHTPIGVKIGSQTPKEIAVSITAQIIQVLSETPPEFEIGRTEREKLREESGKVVCALITEKRGSAPRGKGACMFICSSGNIIGTAGGGRWEADIIKDAKEMLINGTKSMSRTYSSVSEKAGCGGEIDVEFEVDIL